MLLLEIGYSKKYDTFTGYICRDSEYFSYEVNREGVELSPIRQNFADQNHFIREFSKKNPHSRFLKDPITIKELTYDDLKRYKSLSLPVDEGPFPMKKLGLILLVLALAAGACFVFDEFFKENPQREIIPPYVKTPVPDSSRYYYEIRLARGGSLDGFDLKQDGEKILITNRNGLDITIDLSEIQSIEKVSRDNRLDRRVIFGEKESAKK